MQGERQRITQKPINGAALLGRLRGRRRPHRPTRPQRHRPNPDAVVDCALYVNGRRVPGQPH
jgi:magnesium transporter